MTRLKLWIIEKLFHLLVRWDRTVRWFQDSRNSQAELEAHLKGRQGTRYVSGKAKRRRSA